uniref:hypothetical protein n=1 Tax=Streptomyces sp. CHD11 TaxID=2741325 RepID=UPI001BFCB382|nr:hypothetical protein [Streptomyces sp. CHD11]
MLGAAHVGVGHALERRGFSPGPLTGTPAPLDHGDLESALPAGAAVPGVPPPAEREGRTFVDGGVFAYVPVRAALKAGAAGVVMPSTGPEGRPLPPAVPPRRAGAAASRAGLVLLRHRVESELREAAAHVPTAVVPTGIEGRPAPWDLGHAQRMIDTAALAGGRFLDRLRIEGPGLHGDDDSPAAVPSAAPGTARTFRGRRAGR